MKIPMLFPGQVQEPLTFAKMAGGGNDFVVIDNRGGRVTNVEEFARRICTPHLSVGADGLILIEESERAGVRMIYYNADGSRADFCANGTRCAARFALFAGIGAHRMTIETDAGVMKAEIDQKGGLVTLWVSAPASVQLERPLRVADQTIRGTSLIVGVPHYVIFLSGDLWSSDIVPLGQAIRNHPDLQPLGANVNFVLIRDSQSIEVRTYERGVEAETLSCGSGVVASVTASALFDRVKSPVKVLTRSGISFEVSFVRTGNEVRELRLKGDARVVFRGSMTAETLEGFDPAFFRKPTEPALSA
jgi:diaminopimelate epimerase